jgi:hypothetical protein
MKDPTIAVGDRVETAEGEGEVIKVENCGRLTVQYDCGLIDWIDAADIVRRHIADRLHEKYYNV